MPQARSGGSSGSGSGKRSGSSSGRRSTRSSSSRSSGGSSSSGRSSASGRSSSSGRSTSSGRSGSGSPRKRTASKRTASKRSTSSRSTSSRSRSTSNSRTTRSAAGSVDPRVEEVAKRIRKLNERIIEASREAGETTLTSYERALKAIAKAIQSGPGSSDVEWISNLATAQAKFIRDLTTSTTSAARKILP
ncbi:MAG TPA: hypothetical protein VMD09_08860 [Solirubrobacteraceae bacterium]|nr:hypothetical protein [Solirubrobacteraceae bacterium]